MKAMIIFVLLTAFAYCAEITNVDEVPVNMQGYAFITHQVDEWNNTFDIEPTFLMKISANTLEMRGKIYPIVVKRSKDNYIFIMENGSKIMIAPYSINQKVFIVKLVETLYIVKIEKK